MSKINGKKILSTARTEYLKWICNARMIMLFVLLIFIYSFIIEPLSLHAIKMNSPLNILEPFIATVNSEILMIIVPAVFMALFSDFPRTDGNTLFFLQRIGKLNWILGQILYSLMAIVTYVVAIFMGSVAPLLAKSFWANAWSLTVTRYAREFPNESQCFACLLIRGNVYNQVSPFYAAFIGYALMVLYLFLISLILLLFQCLKMKKFGMLTSAAVIAFGGTMCLIKMKTMWIFPMAHASIWMHFTKYYRKPVVPMWHSFVYFIAVCICLIALSILVLKNASIDSVQDID